MTYNELITAQRETKKMGKTFYTTDYKDLGIDWMDNVLFTTEEIVKKYPDVVQAVVTGRYKGFKWALENPKETFEILKKINESLDFNHEMDAVDPMKALMITADTKKNGLGYIHPKKWENVAKDMFKAGFGQNAGCEKGLQRQIPERCDALNHVTGARHPEIREGVRREYVMSDRVFLEQVGHLFGLNALGSTRLWEVRHLRKDHTLPPLIYVVESEAGRKFLSGREMSGRPKFNRSIPFKIVCRTLL